LSGSWRFGTKVLLQVADIATGGSEGRQNSALRRISTV
jgi:hypothetical protein